MKRNYFSENTSSYEYHDANYLVDKELFILQFEETSSPLERNFTQMKTKIILITFAFFFLLGCDKKNEKYRAPDFNKNIQVKPITLNDKFVFDIGQLNIIDTFIICSGKTDINDLQFHVFSIADGKYVTSFGTTGQGPGELKPPVTGFCVDPKLKNIYFWDSQQYKLNIYTLEDILLKNEKKASSDKLLLLMNNILSQHFLSLGNNEFIGCYGTQYRFAKINSNDVTMTTYNEYVKLKEPEEYKKIERGYYGYNSFAAVKPDGTKLVNVTSSGCIFEIFSLQNNLITSTVKKMFFEPVYEVTARNSKYPIVQWSSDAIAGMKQVVATDKYIYVNYNNTKDRDNFYKSIAIFDWDGNPIKRLNFNKKYISFTIDNNDEYGYALMEDNESNFKLNKFRLN